MRRAHQLPVEEFIARFAPGEYDCPTGDADWDSVPEHPAFNRPNPANPDRIHADTMDVLVDSVRTHGLQEPVTIDSYWGNRVLDGHHRVVAAMRTGQPVPYLYS